MLKRLCHRNKEGEKRGQWNEELEEEKEGPTKKKRNPLARVVGAQGAWRRDHDEKGVPFFLSSFHSLGY